MSGSRRKLKELRSEIRKYTAGDFRRNGLQAEIDLLEGETNSNTILLSAVAAIAAAIAAAGSMIAAIVSLMARTC